MDAFTHAAVGLAITGLTGDPFSQNQPVYLASMLGSLAPDCDIITWTRGNLAYLKHHRAFSHSLVGITLWSALITTGLVVFYPQTSLAAVFGWALAGGLSHVLLDFFNTHGAALFWPVCKQRYSCPLLNVIDPLLLSLILTLFVLPLSVSVRGILALVIILTYLIGRQTLKQRSLRKLRKLLGEGESFTVTLMPSLKRLLYWDFVVETQHQYFIGKIGIFRPLAKFTLQLPKPIASKLTLYAQATPLGKFFCQFTPFFYFEEQQRADFTQVVIYDLRYFKNQFSHCATILFDAQEQPRAAYIQSLGSTVQVPC